MLEIIAIGISAISLFASGLAIYFSKKSLIDQNVTEEFYQPFKIQLQLLLKIFADTGVFRIDKKAYEMIIEVCKTDKRNYFKKKENKKLENLLDCIVLYNGRELVNFTEKLLIQQFEKGFEKLYGSIVDGEEPIYDNEKNIVDYTDHYYLPIELINRSIAEKEILPIIENAGRYTAMEQHYTGDCYEGIEEYIDYNKYQAGLYYGFLHIINNGQNYKLPDAVIETYYPAHIFITVFDDIDKNIIQSSEYKNKLFKKEEVSQKLNDVIKIVDKKIKKAYRLYKRV